MFWNCWKCHGTVDSTQSKNVCTHCSALRFPPISEEELNIHEQTPEEFHNYLASLPKPLDARPYYQRNHLALKQNLWKRQREFEPIPTEADTAELWRILSSRERKCEACGVTVNLEVHHIKPRRDGGSNEPKNLRVLCVQCHAKEDPYRRRFLR